MPTLVQIDGFAHKVLATSQTGSDFAGTYTTVSNGGTVPNNGGGGLSFDTSVKRTSDHICSLKIIQDGVTATRVARNVPTAGTLFVASLYFRIDTAPVAQSILFRFTGPTNAPLLEMKTDGKLIMTQATTVTTAASYADSAWHLLDIRSDVSSTTFVCDWAIDGVAQTQISDAAQTSANITSYSLGSTINGDNLTAYVQDVVISATTGDYPIGAHIVLPLYPNANGTHVLGTTNPIIDEAAGSSDLSSKVDDWNGSVPSTTDYITYTSTTLGDAASNYAEFGFTNPTLTTIWDVTAIFAGFASGTGADTASLKFLTAHSGTQIDIFSAMDYSGSSTVLGYHRRVLTRPAGDWTSTNLSAMVANWGLSSDTNAIPRLAAAMLEYAGVPVTTGQTEWVGVVPI